MAQKIKELREKNQKLVADARAKLDEIKDDTAAERAKEIEAEYDKIMAEVDKNDEEIKTLEEREKRRIDLEAREAELNRPDPRRPSGQPEQHGDRDVETDRNDRRSAFHAYLRYGASGMSQEQRALLVRAPIESRANNQSSQVGVDGGYLVPAQMRTDVVISMKAYGPMMDSAIVREINTDTGGDIPWPTMDDTSNEGRQIEENVQVSLAEIQFGSKTLKAYKFTSDVVLVPSELLQDAAVDIETLIRNAMAERIGRIGNRKLTTGTGANTPLGIVTGAASGATAASSTAILFDDVISLEHAVDPAYRAAATCRFQMNDNTLKAIRKLKDGEGRYIWQPADMKAGLPNNIDGYPYSVNQVMADISSGNKSMIFGDHNRYVRRMVNQFSIRRLVERYADYDQVGFIGFTRFDGTLIDAGAVKALAHP